MTDEELEQSDAVLRRCERWLRHEVEATFQEEGGYDLWEAVKTALAQSDAEPVRVTDEMVKAASDVLFERTSIAFGGTYMREALEAALNPQQVALYTTAPPRPDALEIKFWQEEAAKWAKMFADERRNHEFEERGWPRPDTSVALDEIEAGMDRVLERRGFQTMPPDTSAGLIEAAKIAEEWDSGWGEDRNTRVARQTAIEIAEAIRARAADRSGK